MEPDSCDSQRNAHADLELRLNSGLILQKQRAQRSRAVTQDAPLVTLERLQSVLPHGLRSGTQSSIQARARLQPSKAQQSAPITVEQHSNTVLENAELRVVLEQLLPDQQWSLNQTQMLALTDGLAKAEHEHDFETSLTITDALVQTHIRCGRYQAARDWANWAAHLHERSRITSPCNLGLRINAQVLGGVVEDVREALTHLGDQNVTDAVSLELAVADAQVSVGDLQAALERYARLWSQCEARELLAGLALRYVHALCESQQVAKALELAQQAVSLSVGLPASVQREAHLSQAIALAHHAPTLARAKLEQLLISCLSPMDAPLVVRAAAQLARVCLSLSDLRAARQAIDRARPALAELGPCGHRLLIGSAQWHAVYELITPEEPVRVPTEVVELELYFLGQCTASLAGQPLRLRRRFAEIIAVLAMNPDGLTGEQLTLAVYGDDGTLECCKTELSRLRQLLPIKTRPYQLGTQVKADFLDLETLLEQGELEMAFAVHTGPLLPDSDAPGIVSQREHLEETVRQAALQSQDPNLLWHCAERASEDLDLWQATLDVMEKADPRRALANARREHLHKTWCL